MNSAVKKMASKLQILVCGGGNGAHVFAGLSALNKNNTVHWLSTFGTEAETINKRVQENDGMTIHFLQSPKTSIAATAAESKESESTEVKMKAKPQLITNDPSKAIPGSDVILICLPAFAHKGYVDLIAKDIKKGTVVGVFPSAGGFEFEWLNTLRKYGKTPKDYTLLCCLTLPWACRIAAPLQENSGKLVEVLCAKSMVDMVGAGEGGNAQSIIDGLALMQKRIIGDENNPKLTWSKNNHVLLGTLGATNTVIHPSIMYEQWREWNQKAMKTKPLFYQGITQQGLDVMEGLSAEAAEVGKAITKELQSSGSKSDINKVEVVLIKDWYYASYADQSTDTSSTLQLIRTNAAYNGLTHPMKKSAENEDLWVPNFGYRYLTEDIPFGLLPVKGLAQLVNVKTPTIDKVVTWAQGVMGREYLDEKMLLTGKDVPNSRAPQAYKGMDSIKDILGAL